MTLEEEISVLLDHQDPHRHPPVSLIRVVMYLYMMQSSELRSVGVNKVICLIKDRLAEALISPIPELRELAKELSKEQL